MEKYITEKIWYLPYIYTATTNTSGNYTYYGIKDSEYYVITSTNRWLYDDDQVYTGNYVYQETTATSSSISTLMSLKVSKSPMSSVYLILISNGPS